MRRNFLHIWMTLVVALTAPTASVVRLSCADSGATTLTMCTYDTGCASDPCCPGGTGTASVQANCCRTDVFSLASTSPVPNTPVAHALPVFIGTLSPQSTVMPVSHVATNVTVIPPGRNLPLLV
jgi:hypothetical protein